MTKAFLYDSLCGLVYRCMFAGVDELGHAQWVNITPGEEPKTLSDYLTDEDLEGTRFFVLAMEGETAQTVQVAKVLGKAVECPIDGLGADLGFALSQMRSLGVKWDKTPLEVRVRVFKNTSSHRRGKFSIIIDDLNSSCSTIADIDGFDEMEELMWTVRNYFLILEGPADIPVITKSLTISNELKKELRKNHLGMFTRVSDEL